MTNSCNLPEGLRVFVSAGASGIGHTIADAFADCGAKLWVRESLRFLQTSTQLGVGWMCW